MAERVAGYIKTRKIRGAEIILVKQFMEEGKSDIEVDFTLLNYNSEEISVYMDDMARTEADFSQAIADGIDSAVKNGDPIPQKYIDKSNQLRRKASFIRTALKKIFPNLY